MLNNNNPTEKQLKTNFAIPAERTEKGRKSTTKNGVLGA